MSEEPQYDPRTCVKAKELREMGMDLPASIPDEAWVPRHAMEASPGKLKMEGDVIEGFVNFNFTEPFRWIELKVATMKKPAPWKRDPS